MVANMKLFLLSLFLLLCLSFKVQQNVKEAKVGSGNLGFGNQTGSGVVAGQVSAFINYINSASTYYRDDELSKLSYIANQMNIAYGRNGYQFSVIKAKNSAYSWSIYPSGSVFASLAPGVDRLYPNASFMFIQDYSYGYQDLMYLEDQKGSGIDSSVYNVIKNIIVGKEVSSYCTCFETSDIALALKSYDGNSWSVLCSAYDDIYALVYSYAEKFVYTSPRYCYYAIYAI